MNKCYYENSDKNIKGYILIFYFLIFFILSQLIDHDSNTIFYIITMTVDLKP